MATDTLHCRCGHTFAVGKRDGAGEPRCPACGAMFAVGSSSAQPAGASTPTGTDPVGDAKPARQVPKGSIFSKTGREQLSRKTIRHTVCECGRTVAYRLDDLGKTSRCECGRSVRFGQELNDFGLNSSAAADDHPLPQVRFRLVRSRAVFSIMIALFVLIGLGGYFAASLAGLPELMNHQVDTLVKNARDGGPIEAFDPAKLDTGDVAALAKQADFFRALKQALAWRHGLVEAKIAGDDPRLAAISQVIEEILTGRRDELIDAIKKLAVPGKEPLAAENSRSRASAAARELHEWSRVLQGCGLGETDQPMVVLREVADQLAEQTDPITPAMINALRTSKDYLKSLQQAQLWQEALVDRRAAPADPRFALLATVIEELRERLVPRAKDRPWVKQFRDSMQTLAERLAAKDLNGARTSRDVCETLRARHPADDLRPFAARYLTLTEVLRELENEIEGLQRIDGLFAAAEASLSSGDMDRVSEAIAARSDARQLVRTTPLTPDDAARLDDRLTKLKTQFQLALGRRAVRDAVACDKAGDAAARDHQARRAAALLPGLPEDEIRDEMKKIEAWVTAAEVKTVVPTTSAGKELLIRDLYEAALEQFGVGNTQAMARACEEYQQRAVAAGIDHPDQLTRLKATFFDLLKVQINHCLKELASVGDPGARLVEARAALDIGKLWKDELEWTTLDAALQQQGERLAREAIDAAARLAAAERYDDALTALAPALSLGGKEAKDKAGALQLEWRELSRLRTEEQAEAAQWAHVRQLSADPSKALETALELKAFLERYSGSRRADEARRLQASLRPAIDSAFVARIQTVEKAMSQNNWREAVKGLRELEASASGSTQLSQLSPLQQRAAEQHAAIKREYDELRSNTIVVNTDAETLRALRIAGTLALFEPENAAIVALLEKARTRAAVIARRLVFDFRSRQKTNPKGFEDAMTRAMMLDPYGDAGREARKLLDGAKAKS